MNYRTLGRTGLQFSEIGFGAWGIGKGAWIGAEDDESRPVILPRSGSRMGRARVPARREDVPTT